MKDPDAIALRTVGMHRHLHNAFARSTVTSLMPTATVSPSRAATMSNNEPQPPLMGEVLPADVSKKDKTAKPKPKPKLKKCSNCGIRKPYSSFPPHGETADGYATRCKSCRNEAHAKRRKSNIMYRLKHHIATRVEKQCNVPKGFVTNLPLYLGYQIGELRAKLEKEMHVKHGFGLKRAIVEGWHLDHIKPLSLFNVVEIGDDEFRACWAISNLEMKPAAENLAKGAKWEEAVADGDDDDAEDDADDED